MNIKFIIMKKVLFAAFGGLCVITSIMATPAEKGKSRTVLQIKQSLTDTVWHDAEELAGLIEQLPDETLDTIFIKEKYGNYLRNFQGLAEHTHYHLGQIVLIKKMLKKNTEEPGV